MTRDLPGACDWQSALEHPELLAKPVFKALQILANIEPTLTAQALVAEIDPEQADTAAMSESYGIGLEWMGNCVLIAGKRNGEERIAACVVLGTTRTDVNHRVKKLLNVRKCSFWPQDTAVQASGMEYGGITAVGVPENWRILIDSRVVEREVIIGSGLRRSKLLVPGILLSKLPQAEIITDLAQSVD